jgi:fatty-acyl-CoA synthase
MVAAVVPNDRGTLTPAGFESFLASQPDPSPKPWPRYVRITTDLPTTATHKVLKRRLAAEGTTSGDGELWVREPRGTRYTIRDVRPCQ